MVTFDDALPALVGACEHAPGFASLKTACVVREANPGACSHAPTSTGNASSKVTIAPPRPRPDK